MVDDRTYIKVHDGMPDHPKVDGLSDRAFRLLIETWCWCSRHLTDGLVPRSTWVKRGTSKSRLELITAGLAEDQGELIVMHDYTEHQRSLAEVAERRATKRRASAKGNHQRWHVGPTGNPDPSCEHCICDPPPSPTGSQVGSQVGSPNGIAGGIAGGIPNRSTEVEVEIEEKDKTNEKTKPSSATAEPPRDDVDQLCSRLRERMIGNGFKEPTITVAWRRQARLMIDTDGRDLTQALRLIDWATADEFWHPNIKSMAKLRAQYDTLLARARQEHQRRKDNTRPPQRTTDDKVAEWQRLKNTTDGATIYSLPAGEAS